MQDLSKDTVIDLLGITAESLEGSKYKKIHLIAFAQFYNIITELQALNDSEDSLAIVF